MITTTDDIRKIRPIADNVNDTKRLIPYIEECEKLFLIPAIGPALYKKLDSDNKPDNFETLMSGGYYDNDNEYFPGLREAMGYLVYSRFVRNNSVNATAFGIVQNRGQFSDPVDEKTIVRVANDAEKIGLNYLKQCLAYINFGLEWENQKKYKVKSKFKVIGR